MQLQTHTPEFHAVKLGSITVPSANAAPRIDLSLDETLEELADQIRHAYARQIQSGSKTIEEILNVGGLCQKARNYIATLGNETPRAAQLEVAIRFSKGSISRYCKIVNNSVITNPKNHDKLPSSVFSLHALCAMSDLQERIDSGEINPTMRRHAITELVGAPNGDHAEEPAETVSPSDTTVDAFTVSFPSQTWEESYGGFENHLRELLKRYDDAHLSYGKPVHQAKIEVLRKQAQEHIERLLPELPEETRKQRDLIDNALYECDEKRNGIPVFIKETGKNGFQLLPDWALLPNLCEALDLDPTKPVYRSTIIKQARAKKIVCRVISLASLNREVDLWIALLNFCEDNQRPTQVKKLHSKTVEVLEGAKATPEAERIKEIAGKIYADVRYL